MTKEDKPCNDFFARTTDSRDPVNDCVHCGWLYLEHFKKQVNQKCKKWTIGNFLISICELKSAKTELKHYLIHFTIALVFGWKASVGVALGLEVRDGELNKIEGFNIFPDLFFRILGATIGYVVRCLIIEEYNL